MCISIVAVLLSSGCGERLTDSEIRARFALHVANSFGPLWRIENFSVEASERTGGNVSPTQRSRFKAVVVNTEPTYVRDGQIDGVGAAKTATLLRVAMEKGTRISAYGIGKWSLAPDGEWKGRFSTETEPRPAGRGLSHFNTPDGGVVIIIGTEEYEAHIALLEQEKAEQERREQEERLRLAALERARVARERDKVIDFIEREKGRFLKVQGKRGVDEGFLGFRFSDIDRNSGKGSGVVTYHQESTLFSIYDITETFPFEGSLVHDRFQLRFTTRFENISGVSVDCHIAWFREDTADKPGIGGICDCKNPCPRRGREFELTITPTGH